MLKFSTILILQFSLLTGLSQTTCGVNCDATYDALDAQSNIDFNTLDNTDGFRTVCLQGDQGGFTWSQGLDFKTTSRLYICETSDNVNIDITGSMSFNGTNYIYVNGSSKWSNLGNWDNNTNFIIESSDTLEIDEPGTTTHTLGNNFALENDGTFILKDNLFADRDNSTWDNDGDIIIDGNISNWNFDYTGGVGSSFHGTGTISSNNNGSIDSYGDVTFDGAASSMDMDITIRENAILDFNSSLEGTHSMTMTVYGELNVSGHVDQDFYLVIENGGRVEAYSDWDMEHKFENQGAWLIDGDLEMNADAVSNFAGGYIVSSTLSWNGSNSFSATASDCGLIIFDNALGQTGSALDVTPVGSISLASASTIDNGDNDYDDFGILENANFTISTPVTNTPEGNLKSSSDLQDQLESQSCTNNVLPLILLDFSATTFPDKNLITWTIGSNNSNSSVHIERSTNGIDFISLDHVNMEAALTVQSFELSDNNEGQFAYYRITVFDQDENKVQSRLTQAGNPQQISTSFNGQLYEIITKESDTFTIRVYSTHGQVLITSHDSTSINLDHLSKGTYLIEVEGHLVEKVVK